MTRTATGEVNNMSILNNTVTFNNRSGINLISANAFKTDTYTINNNVVSNNVVDGIRLDVRADAQLSAFIDNNQIIISPIDSVQRYAIGLTGRAG